jgi:hypothetical protein
VKTGWLKLGIIVFVIAGVVWTRVFADGSVNVFAPASEALVVTLDGEHRTEVPKGTLHRVSVPRGKHQLTLQRGAEQSQHDIFVVDGTSWFLLTAPGQCMVHVDISRTYVREGQKAPPPLIERRQKPGETVPLTGNVYLPGKEAPTIGSKGARVVLVREIGCEAVELAAEELLQYFDE